MEQETSNIKETSSLSQSRKGPKRSYGATRAQESAPDFKIVQHNLTSTDTLQGLAIKYGVTVEQIRRVNKLWTNDNIRVFKTLSIPIKIDYAGDIVDTRDKMVNLVDITVDFKSTKTETCKSSRVKVTRGDKGTSRDPCCEEGTLRDTTSIDGNVADRNHITKVKDKNGSKSPESLSKFLNQLDDQMKSSIQQAEQQRTTSGVALINNLENNIEKESLKRHKTNEAAGQRMPAQLSQTHRSNMTSETANEMTTLDHLFEL